MEVEGAVDEALARAEKPELAYEVGNELERRVMAGSFFERIEIGPDGGVTDPALQPEYDALKAWCPSLGQAPVNPGSSSIRFQPSSNHVHFEEALHVRGFCRFALAPGSPVIVVLFRHWCLKARV